MKGSTLYPTAYVLGAPMLSAPSRICFPPLCPTYEMEQTTSSGARGTDCRWWLPGRQRPPAGPGEKGAGNGFLVPKPPPNPTLQHLDMSTVTPPVPHLDPACLCLFPSGDPWGHLVMHGVGGRGATHVVEHFVELLGVHDKVGVAYHVVDCICLDRRDTEDSERPAMLCGCQAQGLGQADTGPGSSHIRAFTSISKRFFSCLISTYLLGLP